MKLDLDCRKEFRQLFETAKRWSIVVAHRRAGKTVACVQKLIVKALYENKSDGRYAYIAPFREQAKTVAWNYLKHYAYSVVREPENDLRESDLQVRLINGSSVRLFGADNPNALRGMYLDGVVLDEYADMRLSLWGEVIRPALSDRNGWAVFIGTPRGRNAFWDLYDEAGKDDAWLRMMLKASETKLLPEAELADARKTMTENQYEQEYECSFEAAVIGAVYAKELHFNKDKVITLPYDGTMLVHAALDIGIGDPTALWFYQLIGHEIRFIDYFEDSNEAAPYYASILKARGYRYDTAWLPHDAFNKQSATGLSFAEALRDTGLKVEMVQKLPVQDGVNAAKMLFPRCYFDAKKCAPGLEALAAYRWDYNIRMDQVKNTAVHDWSSHAADAFRYMALSVRRPISQRPSQPLKYPKKAYA